MTMTVGKLREQLNGVGEDTALYICFEGTLKPIESIAIAATGTLAVIRGKGQPRKSKHFTTTEDGLIGGLNAMGASDTMISEVLERSESSIKQRKKLIGLS